MSFRTCLEARQAKREIYSPPNIGCGLTKQKTKTENHLSLFSLSSEDKEEVLDLTVINVRLKRTTEACSSQTRTS